jgi:hypothetical protein
MTDPVATTCSDPTCTRGAAVLCTECRRAFCARHVLPAWEAESRMVCVSCFEVLTQQQPRGTHQDDRLNEDEDAPNGG